MPEVRVWLWNVVEGLLATFAQFRGPSPQFTKHTGHAPIIEDPRPFLLVFLRARCRNRNSKDHIRSVLVQDSRNGSCTCRLSKHCSQGPEILEQAELDHSWGQHPWFRNAVAVESARALHKWVIFHLKSINYNATKCRHTRFAIVVCKGRVINKFWPCWCLTINLVFWDVTNAPPLVSLKTSFLWVVSRILQHKKRIVLYMWLRQCSLRSEGRDGGGLDESLYDA